MEDKGIWVWDLETLFSCFTACFYNIHTEEIKKFVIHEELDEHVELYNFLKTCKGLIGFNSLSFDYPIIHYFILEFPKWIAEAKVEFLHDKSTHDIIQLLYYKAQELINNNSSFGTIINPKEVLIPQLDLYRIHHFNNKARSQSLKGLEIAMNYPNVMDMPIKHDKKDITIEEVEQILEYNLNDVMATYKFYELTKDKINLRKDLDIKYNLNCVNYPDSKIGEQLVFKLYCELTGKSKWEVKEQRTNRSSIVFKDCIFDYIKFETKEFNLLLTKLKSKIITETKDSIKESVVYKGFKYDYGTGGIHGCIKAGVYTFDEDYIIIDADVGSLYPTIAVVNKLYPEHLGEQFIEVYEGILKQRIQAKKEGNMSLSDGFKLSLNSVYG